MAGGDRGNWARVRRALRVTGAGAFVVAAGAGSLALGAAGAGAAPATSLTCGSVVTSTTTLTHTLTCRSYEGDDLTIEASGITFNLGGHTIVSHSSETGVAIEVDGGSHVTVTNGHVVTAWTGVVATGTTYLTITHVGISDPVFYTDDYGFVLFGDSHLAVTDDVVTGGTEGVSGEHVSTSSISSNTIDDSLLLGFNVFNFSHTTISANTVSDSGGDGIFLATPAADTVSGNRVEYDADYGVYATTRVSGVNIDVGTPDHCYNAVCIG